MRPETTAEQRELQDAARALLAREVDPDRLRRWEDEPSACDPVLAARIAELGWLGLGLPSSAGGGGADLADVASLVEECARGLLPRPLLGAMRSADALATLDGGDPLLPELARGERRLALALDELQAREPANWTTATSGAPGRRVVDGEKAYVPDADAADLHLLAARDGASIGFALVDRRAPGVSVRPLRTFGGDRQGHVEYRRVPVLREFAPAGGPVAALERVRRRQAALALAEMVGGMAAVLEMTVEYVKVREQFGQKIAVFQAVRHQVADMGTTFTAARHLAWQTITRVSAGASRDVSEASAIAWVGQAFKRLCWTAHHLHGGAGFVVEHRLRFHGERAQSLCIRFAPEAPALREIAASLLD
ncbi:acyl-CoA/acyl-ACP dehydrogenase [bacterium]|nr:acyl-CoA/acyl-ACP dehydrogenase [bacterium]